MGALLFLTLATTKNRVRSRLRRLREVRYAAGLIVGLLYFYFMFGGHTRSTGVYGALASQRELVEMIASVILFVIAVATWAWPSDGKATLMFTRAEVQFLFPAPFSRQQLITYKLARMLLGSLLSSAIVTLFFRPSTLASGWMFLAGFALVTSILIVHLTAVSLSRASLREHGWVGLAHQWLPLAIVFGAVAILGGTLAGAWPRLATLETRGLMMWELHRLSTHGLAGIVLWPFRAVAQLPLAPAPADFFRALPVPLALLVLSFIWAVRTDAAFEEASAELAEKVASIKRGTQPVAGTSRRRSAPFALAASGPAEIALLWKNLIMLGRFASLRRVVRFLPAVVIIGVALSLSGRSRTADTIGFLCLMMVAMTLLIGPLLVRTDLRQDLQRIDVLKAWPISGAVLVRGEALAPTVVLTVVAWMLIVGATALSARAFVGLGLAASSRLSYTVAAFILAPGIVATQVMVQNGIAVIFPAWVSPGASRGQGIDVMGQRMLMMAGMVLTLLLAVLPAAILAAVVAGLVFLAISVIPVIVPSAVVTTILLIECVVASELLGRVVDRTDPTAIEPVE